MSRARDKKVGQSGALLHQRDLRARVQREQRRRLLHAQAELERAAENKRRADAWQRGDR